MDDDWTLASFGDFAVCHVLRGLAAAAAAAAVILAISANRLPFSALALASAATSTFIAAAWMRLVKNPPWDVAVIGLHLLLICGWVVTSRQSDPTGVAALALMPAALQRKRLGWVLDGVAVLVIGGWIAASRAPATVPEWAAACTTLVMMAISGATAITVRILVDRYDAKTDALVAEHFEDGRLEERLALARDLHDTVTKTLFGCAAYARVQARDLEARRDPLADRERKLVRLLEAAESEARHFLVQLRSDSPEDVDYSSGIAALAKHYDGLKFHYSGDFPAPSNVQTQLLLHRAVRELLENVYRHSGSGQVWMDSHREGDVITFSVRDDGCGFDTSTLADKARLGHYGLAGVRETATDLCGTVDIESGPDGTLVELRVPAM